MPVLRRKRRETSEFDHECTGIKPSLSDMVRLSVSSLRHLTSVRWTLVMTKLTELGRLSTINGLNHH